MLGPLRLRPLLKFIVKGPPLTASFESVPTSHNGSGNFKFRIAFSEEFSLSYLTLRDDHVFTVEGGEVAGARRLVSGSNIRWEISVSPDSNGDVTVELPVTEDCEAQGAICTEDKRTLSSDSSPIPTNLSRHRGPKSPRNSSKPLSGPGVLAAPCPGFTDDIRRDLKLTEEYSLDQKVQQLLSPEQIRSSVGGSVGLAHPVSDVIPRAR